MNCFRLGIFDIKQTGPADFAGPVEIKFEDFWKNSIIKCENFGKMLEIYFEENAFF